MNFLTQFPELSDSQLAILERLLLECVGEDEKDYLYPMVPELERLTRNRLRAEIRANIVQMLETDPSK